LWNWGVTASRSRCQRYFDCDGSRTRPYTALRAKVVIFSWRRLPSVMTGCGVVCLEGEHWRYICVFCAQFTIGVFMRIYMTRFNVHRDQKYGKVTGSTDLTFQGAKAGLLDKTNQENKAPRNTTQRSTRRGIHDIEHQR
ncbi:hypothetical protein K523DRAFT_384371, partial [Schizophyllum commune Tattone D]